MSWIAKFLELAQLEAMPDEQILSPESARLVLLRMTVSSDNQLGFAKILGISPSRWNNFERGMPLSKEIAFKICRTFPGVTLDWLYFGNPAGLTLDWARRLGEFGGAGNATTVG